MYLLRRVEEALGIGNGLFCGLVWRIKRRGAHGQDGTTFVTGQTTAFRCPAVPKDLLDRQPCKAHAGKAGGIHLLAQRMRKVGTLNSLHRTGLQAGRLLKFAANP